MPDRLKLTQNAQFFRADTEITDETISRILNSASSNKSATEDFIINETRIERTTPQDEVSYKYSVRVFPTSRPVYFLEENIKDKIYAYIIIIEIQNVLVILKKSCASFMDEATQDLKAVSGSDLSKTFNDNEVDFQKISLRNMTVSDRALRAKSYEAADLKGLLSTHAAGRSIPYFLKIRQGGAIKTISSNSGRLMESAERRGIDEIAKWASDQIDLLNGATPNKGFLESFAKRIELSEVLATTSPSSIFIESSMLYDLLQETGAVLKIKTRSGNIVDLKNGVQDRILRDLESVFEIADDLRIIGYERSSRIRTNTKSISITSNILKRILVEEDASHITLQNYIKKNNLFSVTFKDPKYMYFMGRCFEDSAGISEIQSILDMLIPIADIDLSRSEKGNPTATCTNFDASCMFGIMETQHRNDDYILCDDLGNEWADHITLNRAESCICFIHSKHGDVSKSASNLHDVVGQGIKNLGNMYFRKDEFFEKKLDKLESTYTTGGGIDTSIPRGRKGNIADLDAFLSDLLKNYRLHRKCILACSFLSKQVIEDEFGKITRRAPVAGNIVQLLWILSSFAHAAKEMNIFPLVYCRP